MRITLATIALATALGGTAHAHPKSQGASMTPSFDAAAQTASATALLHAYEAALNAADVDAVLPLYAPDGVFMAQHRDPSIGHDQIREAYTQIFEMIRLDITFAIDEVVVVTPTLAYARTRSAGTTTVLANGAKVSEGNQELFLLMRNDQGSDWKIGRYIFSTTQPPRG